MVSAEDIKATYDAVRTIPVEFWNEENYQTIEKDLNISHEKAIGLSVVAKVAHQLNSFEEFENAVNENEFPAIKLSAAESESIKGGLLIIEGILLVAAVGSMLNAGRVWMKYM